MCAQRRIVVRRKPGTFLSVATLWYRIFGSVPRQHGDSCARHPAVQGLVIGTETIRNRCQAAPSNAASLIVAHGTLGKAILLQVSCHTSKIVNLFSFLRYVCWQKRMLLKTQFHRPHQQTSLSLSIVGCFTNIEALLATALGLPEEASCRLIYGAWACLPCFLKIAG